MIKQLLLIATLALASVAAQSESPTYEQEMAAVSRDYQVALYGTEVGDARSKAMDDLITRAADLQARYPKRGMPHAWTGWVKYTQLFSVTDPAAAMPLIQGARVSLEKALEIEPNCCGVEAYVTLAIIYQVPLTGQDQRETVKKYFAKAFELDPKGLTPNTRYAGYLMRSGDFEGALKHANAALAAPPLPAYRAAEDKAVRETAQDFLEQIKERMKK